MIASVLYSVLSSSCRTGIASRSITTATTTTYNVDNLSSIRTDKRGGTDRVETMSVSEEGGTEVTDWTNNDSAKGCTSQVAMGEDGTAVLSVVGRHPLAHIRGAREIHRDDVSHIGESLVTMAGSAYTVQTNNMDDSMASSGVGVQNRRERGRGEKGGGGHSFMNRVCAVGKIDIGSGESHDNDVNRPWF